MWQPDEDLVAATSERRDAFLKDLFSPQSSFDPSDDVQMDMLLDLFDTLGTRSFMRLDDVVPEDYRQDLENLVDVAVKTLNADDLEDAADEILLKAPELRIAEGDALAALEEELVDLLSVRDSVELVLEGARVVLGREPHLPLELETAIVAFELQLKGEMWQLLPLGPRRAANLLWVEPSIRKRLWWWELGMDLPRTALDDLDTAARILYLFPSAHEEFNNLIEAEQTLDDFKTQHEKIITTERKVDAIKAKIAVLSLVIYLRRLRLERLGAQKGAADRGELVLLYETDKVKIFSDGKFLILDILPPSNPASNRVPLLYIEDQNPLKLSPTKFNDRFQVTLDEPQFKHSKGKIVVPLENEEDVVILIPFPVGIPSKE